MGRHRARGTSIVYFPDCRAGRIRGRLCLGHDSLLAAEPSWLDARGVCGGVYVYNWDSSEPRRHLGLPAVRMLHGIDPALVIAPLNADDPHAFA
jgi:hypothetical protein